MRSGREVRRLIPGVYHVVDQEGAEVHVHVDEACFEHGVPDRRPSIRAATRELLRLVRQTFKGRGYRIRLIRDGDFE